VGREEEAFAAIEEAIHLAESTHYELDAWQCRSQRASYLLLIGRVEESIPIYESAVEFLNKTPDGATDRDTLIIDCNLALAYHLLGQNEQAIARLRPIRETARKARMADPLARAETLLGASLAQLGERAEASESLRSGLKAAYPKSPREALDALGDALVALEEWDHPDAERLSQAWMTLLTRYEIPLTYPLRWRIAILNSDESSEPVDLLNTVRWTMAALREV
jgi:tetratricopeptide (TPR) repeat protein